MKQQARLENWYVGPADELCGEAYGHPRFKDGTPVVTSRVVKWDKETKRVTTLNTEYVLGKPRDEGQKR